MPLASVPRAMLLFFSLMVNACSMDRPPQTAFYCLDIPKGKEGSSGAFAHEVADRLNFKVSKAQAHFPMGLHRSWEVYGGGVSMFVSTSMKDVGRDQYGNAKTIFDQNRLEFNVVKIGLFQSVDFDKVVNTGQTTAAKLGWRFSGDRMGQGCAT